MFGRKEKKIAQHKGRLYKGMPVSASGERIFRGERSERFFSVMKRMGVGRFVEV